jgi:hypothetical protein
MVNQAMADGNATPGNKLLSAWRNNLPPQAFWRKEPRQSQEKPRLPAERAPEQHHT